MDLRYFLKGLLLPPCTQLLLLLLAWKIRHRATKVSKVLFYIAFLSLWILSSPVTATFMSRTLEQEPPLRPEELSTIQADAIIILTASQNEYAPEFGQPVSGMEQLIRIRYGAFLQHKTKLPVLVSGGSVQGKEQRSLAATMAYDLLNGFGVKASWQENKSRTTFENAHFSYKILSVKKKTTIVLVTSAMHMMRAKWSFEQAGFTVLPAPTNFIDRRPLNINSFIPSANALDLSSQVIHEWLGYCVYRITKMIC